MVIFIMVIFILIIFILVIFLVIFILVIFIFIFIFMTEPRARPPSLSPFGTAVEIGGGG